MKKLSEFLAEFLFDESTSSLDARSEELKQLASNIKLGIENYQQHLHDDVPKTVQWAMIEKQLITALEHMEFPNKSKKERESCDHHWVERLDGWDGQCGAAICDKCGLYGCLCDAKWRKMTDEEKKEFHSNGINGSKHKLEKLIKMRNDTTGDGLPYKIGRLGIGTKTDPITYLFYCPRIGEFIEKYGNTIDATKCDFKVGTIKSCNKICRIRIQRNSALELIIKLNY